MNVNVFNWLIDTDFFFSVLRALGATLIAVAILLLYVYLKVRQGDSGDSGDMFDSPHENIRRIHSGKSFKK